MEFAGKFNPELDRRKERIDRTFLGLFFQAMNDLGERKSRYASRFSHAYKEEEAIV